MFHFLHFTLTADATAVDIEESVPITQLTHPGNLSLHTTQFFDESKAEFSGHDLTHSPEAS